MSVIRGMRAHARFVCAICACDILTTPPQREPLGPAGALVNVCPACAGEPARALYGPERAYQGAGGALKAGELTRALRAKQGDGEYERESDYNRRIGLRPSARTPDALVALNAVKAEGKRRNATGAAAKVKQRR